MQRYLIENQIGEGGMGAVYRAYDRLTSQHVALKKVQKPSSELTFASKSNTADSRLALANEFKTLSSLRHPNIVSVIDYGFDDEQAPFFTMTLLDKAKPLLKAARTISLDDRVQLIVQLLRAMDYLHRQGILHRDLKPSNVLVVNGEVKVLDFGIAMQTTKKDDPAGDVAGTLPYLAPEMLTGDRASRASDLYAVGLIAYELLAGQYPYDKSNLIVLVDQIVSITPDVEMLDVSKRLQAVIGRLLDKNPRKRYRNASDTIEAIGLATGITYTENRAVRESYLQAARFVGREAEIQQLTAALHEAKDAKGSLWLIGGESGVGKSRLVDELRTIALVEGLMVVRGYGVEGGGLSLQLWRDILARLAVEVVVSDLEAGILKDIVPNIDQILRRDIPDVPSLTGAAHQQRLLLTMTGIIKRQPSPLLILLEDLQWADESLQPVEMLLSDLETLPILIVGNYRTDEKVDLVERLPQASHLTLDRLNRDEINALSSSMLGAVGNSPMVIDLLMRETEGNTFFLVEVARALVEEAGGETNVANITLPVQVFTGGMKQVIQRRLDRIPAEHRPLLKIAAVIGRQIDPVLLHHIVPNVDLERWLYVAADAAVIVVRDEVWQFAHDKLRDAVLQDLGRREKLAVHRRVAEAIETVYPPDDYAEMLIKHWHEAGNSEKELQYLLVAAEEMVFKSSRYESAEAALQRGMKIMKSFPASQWKLYNIRGRLYALKADYPTAVESYEQCLALSGDDKKLQVDALNGLAQVYRLMGEHEKSIDNGSQAVELARDINYDLGMSTALNQLGYVASDRGDVAKARHYLEEALELRRKGGDALAVAAALSDVGIIALAETDYDEARRYFEQSLQIRREAGALHGIASDLGNLGALEFNLGNLDVAEQFHREALDIRRTIGELYGVVTSLNQTSELLMIREEFGLATALLDEALQISKVIGDHYGVSWSLNKLADISLQKKDYTAADAHLDESFKVATEVGYQSLELRVHELRALVASEQNKPADEHLQAMINIALNLDVTLAKYGSLTVLARHYANCGRTVDAAKIVGYLLCQPELPFELKHQLNPLIPQLKAELGQEEYDEGYQQGASLDMNAMLSAYV